MDPVTLTFLTIGGAGVALLLVALLIGEIGHFGGPDADGPFSLPAIAAFIGGVGFVGAIPAALIGGGLGTGPTALVSTVVGVIGALPLAWGAIRLTAGLMRMRTDPTLTEAGLTGALGTVITPIPAAGFGEVRIRVHGQDLKYSARAHTPLAIGTPIYVSEALSASAVEVVSTAD
jgi:hypothetical protein